MADTASPRIIDANGPASGARPDFQRDEYKAGKAARDLCHALMQGTQGVRALGEDALPKWPAEKPKFYAIRAKVSALTGYYARTVQASVGMILATPPKLAENANPLIVADAEDIDGKGTHLEVFAKSAATDAINGGFSLILVDAPPIPDGLTLTHEDELKLGLRPFWQLYAADRLWSWVVEVPDWAALVKAYKAGDLTADEVKAYTKQVIVRQVVLHEPTDVSDGEFGTRTVDRFRQLTLTPAGVTFAVWEHVKATEGVGEHFVQIASGPMLAAKQAPFREIPLAPVYGGRKLAPFVADPALLSLAELNLDHYQVSADRRYMMKLCHAPTLYMFGVEAEQDGEGNKLPVEVGPNSVVTSANPEAKMGYAAADPGALDSSKEEKEELVRQMAALGMSFIGKDRVGSAETATGRALDDAAENANHATVARGLQDGFEQALKYHAMYRGVDAPEITVNTSYAAPQVDPQVAAIIWGAVAVDKMPIEALVSYLKTGELPDDLQEQIDALRFAQAVEEANQADAEAEAAKNGDPAVKGAIAPKDGGAEKPADKALAA